MKKRIITAIVCLALLVPTLIFSDTWVFPAVMTLLALIAVYEICGCIGVRKAFFISIPAYIVTAAVMLLIIYCRDKKLFLPIVCASALAFMFIVFTVSMLSSGNIRFSQSAELVSFTAYIITGFLSILLLREADMGKYLYLLVFIGAWSTDTGAYFVGVLFGKHKLIPEVSPKKTVEGAFGGVLGCVLGFVIYGFIISKIHPELSVNYLLLVLLALAVAVISQLGDLIASFVKREQGIKDFGFIFPGHGGVLDRFDSIIAVAPLIYIASLFVTKDIFTFI